MSYISEKKNDDDTLSFTISKLNVAYVNAIRRVILSDIETVGVITEPYEENQLSIFKNTSKLHNEIIKHRISCIPIHITDYTTRNIDDYTIVLDIKNTENLSMDVTTAYINVKYKGELMTNQERNIIFPLNSLTNDHILIVKLSPNECIKFEGKLSL